MILASLVGGGVRVHAYVRVPGRTGLRSKLAPLLWPRRALSSAKCSLRYASASL